MGTLFSGVGLVSGLDIASLVDQLVQAASGPRDNIVARIGRLDAQRAAYLDISARVSSMLSRINSLRQRDFFSGTKSSSSAPETLGVVTRPNATPGTYNFIVRQLASTHQLVSRGFRSRSTPLTPGRLSIDSSQARVDIETRLDELNGYRGVQRGAFELRDASGARATVDLRDAETLNDVVARINDAGLNIRAAVRGDHLRLTETTGGTLQAQELEGGTAARDLGFGPGKSSATGVLDGADLMYLSFHTPLDALNDGLGVHAGGAGADFTIRGGFGSFDVSFAETFQDDDGLATRLERLNHGNGVRLGRVRVVTTDENGIEAEQTVDLGSAKTVADVRDLLQGALEGVAVTLDGDRIDLAYSDGAERAIRVADVGGGFAAADLGIAGQSDAGRIDGEKILFVETLGDLVNAINFADGNDGAVTAALNGGALTIDAGGAFTLAAADGSDALRDLGFDSTDYSEAATSQRLIGGLNSVLLRSLNGGRGYAGSALQIGANGGSVAVDGAGVQTLGELLERIQDASEAADLGLEARYDATGARLLIRNVRDASELTISGDLADALGLAGSGAELRTDNLQRQYLSSRTPLETLNNGRGVDLGRIRVTNSQGAVRSFSLAGAETLGDVIDRLNADPTFGVSARINDSGDGIVIEDAAGGAGALKIAEESGSAAADLNLLGESETGVIDGTFEIRVDVGAGDTLDDVVARINAAAGGATASVLASGDGPTPYRLQISSTASGRRGALVVDGFAAGLDFSTLSRARDAQVVIGSDPQSGVLVTSATNTITDIVPGLDVDLHAVSAQPVSVTIERDTQRVVDVISGLVNDFNNALQRIGELTKFDAETQERGQLLGDGAVQIVESRLLKLVTGRLPGAGGSAPFDRLADIGVKLKPTNDGGGLEFDEEQFRALFEDDPGALAEFFADPDNGLAAAFEREIKAITDSTGLLARRAGSVGRQRELLSDRVDILNERLERRRDQLTREFLAMESALASLQSQQNAVLQLANLVPRSGSSSS